VLTTKRVKTRLIAALMPMALACVAAQPAVAQLSVPLGDPASWRTPEFLRDNGMLSIGAEFAYAAGYSGTGMTVGIVDSGFFAGHMREHGSLDTNYAIGDRYFSVESEGGETGPT
jgi:subtilase-type serine protease